VTDRGIMTKMATPAYSAGDEHNHSMHVPPLSSAGPACGEEGRRSSGAIFSIVFLFILSLSLALVPQVLPFIYKREGRAPLRRILFWTDRHFTFTSDLEAHPSLDRL
jgi:hypothetical protein